MKTILDTTMFKVDTYILKLSILNVIWPVLLVIYLILYVSHIIFPIDSKKLLHSGLIKNCEDK